MILIADLEWWLAGLGIVTSELDEDPRSTSSSAKSKTIFTGRMTSLDSDDDFDDA